MRRKAVQGAFAVISFVWLSLQFGAILGSAAPETPNIPDSLISGPNYDPSRQTICRQGCDFDSIAAAIDATNPLTPAVFSVLDLELSETNISIDQGKEITIFGVGASRTKIGAGGSGRIFSIEGGAKVTLRNLSIVDGAVADGNGGGLLVNGTGSELVLQFVDLNKNVAQNG
ncbi:MAG: hypothetical protein AAGD96_18840, partial [Chloroflexota bacterium]